MSYIFLAKHVNYCHRTDGGKTRSEWGEGVGIRFFPSELLLRLLAHQMEQGGLGKNMALLYS